MAFADVPAFAFGEAFYQVFVIPFLIVTVLVELGVFYLLFNKKVKKKAKKKKEVRNKVYLTVAAANVISYIVFIVLTFEEMSSWGFSFVGMFIEIPIILFEIGFIYLLAKKVLSLKDCVVAGVAMNVASVAVGLVLYFGVLILGFFI